VKEYDIEHLSPINNIRYVQLQKKFEKLFVSNKEGLEKQRNSKCGKTSVLSGHLRDIKYQAIPEAQKLNGSTLFIYRNLMFFIRG
jgi:hypothetical protein